VGQWTANQIPERNPEPGSNWRTDSDLGRIEPRGGTPLWSRITPVNVGGAAAARAVHA